MKQIEFFRSVPVSRLMVATAVSIVMLGCGGSGGSGGTTATGGTANPYAGSYSGNFVDSSSFIAPVTMTIDATGNISGTLSYTPPVTFTGLVDSSGKGSLSDSKGSFQVTLGAAGRSTLGGGVGTTSNGVFIAAVTNPTGQYSGFAGQYAGTVHNSTEGATGIIALTVSASGVVSGVDLFGVNGVPTLEPVTGTLNSAGQLSYTVDGVTVSGTVALANSIVSGPVSESNGDSATISLNQVPAL